MLTRNILLFATTTGYQTRSFAEAADRLGVRLTLATDRCKTLDDPWRDQAIPVRFHDVAGSVRALRAAARRTPFSGLLAVGDRPVALAAAAARALGLEWHPTAAAEASRNKLRAREQWRAAGHPVPWFAAVPVTTDPSTLDPPFPCVLKPLGLSGSRGVIRADTRAGFDAAFARIRALLASHEVRALRDGEHDRVLVESYLPGDEYAIEGVMEQGRLRVLAIFDKPDPLDGPFFEETIYVTPSRGDAARQRAIEQAVARAAAVLGLHHGPIHAECRVHEERVVVIETAARPIGGLCARALRFSRGAEVIPFEELLLRHALGEPLDAWVRVIDASAVMMIPIPSAGVYRRVDGLDEARSIPYVDDVHITAKPDQRLVPLPEGASYLGFIFSRARTAAEAEAALRTAHGCLRFVVDRAVSVVS